MWIENIMVPQYMHENRVSLNHWPLMLGNLRTYFVETISMEAVRVRLEVALMKQATQYNALLLGYEI